jgi:hypothetical protein
VVPDTTTVYNGQSSIAGQVTARYTYGEPLADGSTFTLSIWQRVINNIGIGHFVGRRHLAAARAPEVGETLLKP